MVVTGRLVIGDRSGALTVWDTTTRQVVRTLGRHTDTVHSLAFSPDGRLFASASEDQTVKVWDSMTDGTVSIYDPTRWEEKVPQEPFFTFRAYKASVEGSLAFSPNGQRLVVPGDKNTVNIWEVTTSGESPSGPQLTLRGAPVRGVAFSPDGRWVASGGGDNSVKLWDAEPGGKPVRTFRGHASVVRRVAFSPDGKQLASASLIRP